MEQLQHPEITWTQRTGFPSWCQEVLGDFDDKEEVEEMPENQIRVLNALKFGKENAIRRRELVALTGLDDRTVRRAIQDLRRTYIILNDQDGQGYYRTYDLDKLQRAWRQERSRALAILAGMKPMRTLLKGAGRI